MLLCELIDGLPITIARGDAEGVRVGDLTDDSRTVVPGSVFVARAGLKQDGRAYAADAVRAGATAILTDESADAQQLAAGLPAGVPVAVTAEVRRITALLAERLHGHPSRRLLLIGITGTNGKSTVTHLVHQLLNRCGLRCGMIGTVQVDDGTEIAPSMMTTPPAAELSRTLATMVEAGCDAAVMEVSSHAIDQDRQAGLSFDAAVFTNVTGDHLDYHGSFEAYLETKRDLFRQLDAGRGSDGAGGGGGPSIMNADDPVVAETETAEPVWCSLERAHEGGWHAARHGVDLDGETLTLTHGGVSITARVPIFGAHNAINTAQAVAVAWSLLGRAGVEDAARAKRIGDALTLVHAPPGRLEPVHQAGDDLRVFVDYAHTGDAMERVLQTLRGLMPSGAKLWCVFGSGGDKDPRRRHEMGRAAARAADRVVLTSDNPRSESPSRIVTDILSGMPPAEREGVLVHIDRAVAIRAAIDAASPGDVVLLAGKGHEKSQVFADGSGGLVEEPFDDCETARAALADRRARTGEVSGGGVSGGVTV